VVLPLLLLILLCVVVWEGADRGEEDDTVFQLSVFQPYVTATFAEAAPLSWTGIGAKAVLEGVLTAVVGTKEEVEEVGDPVTKGNNNVGGGS
jgi:hypothetical protein